MVLGTKSYNKTLLIVGRCSYELICLFDFNQNCLLCRQLGVEFNNRHDF